MQNDHLSTIQQIIDSRRDQHPAWILEAIEHYIKTGDATYNAETRYYQSLFGGVKNEK